MAYLANIKFGELECNTNWQTFSLANWVILSVHCSMMLHNTHDCSIIIDGIIYNCCLPQNGKANNCSLSLHSPKCHHANHVTKYCDSKHLVHLTHNKNSFSQKYIRCLGIYFTNDIITMIWCVHDANTQENKDCFIPLLM